MPNLLQEEAQRRSAYGQALNELNSARNNHAVRWQELRTVADLVADWRGYDQAGREQLLADVDAYRDRLQAYNQAVRATTTVRADRDSEVKQLADLQTALAETLGRLAGEQDPLQREFLENTVASLQAAITESQQRLQQLNTALALAQAQQQAASQALQAAADTLMAHAPYSFIDPVMYWLLTQAMTNFRQAEERLYDAEILVEVRLGELGEAEAARIAGEESCQRAIELRDSGAGPEGALLPVWGGAEDILRASDELGVVR